MPAVSPTSSDAAPGERVEPNEDHAPTSVNDPFAETSPAVGSIALSFPWEQVVELGDGDVLELGRDPQHCSVAVHMPDNVSSRHCRIDVRSGEATVTDLRSTNGTFVDGRRIEPFVPTTMRHECQLGSDPPLVISLEASE